MRPKLTRLLAFALFASSSSSALAQALEWRVSETSGPVSLVNGDQKRAVTRGMKLQPGDAVHAGAGGRAVLVQGRDFVTVSANSRVTVPTADKATGFVKLLQDWGQALFKIEKKGTPHFGVNTPSLAAVVKGTTFSITVDRSGSSLQVTEGAVEVATLDGGARDLLRPGGLASIAAADPYRLNVRGDEVRVLDSPARATVQPKAAGPEPAAEPVTAPPVEVPVETPVNTAVTIDMGVSSAPADLSQVTGGLIAGTAAPVQLAAITATVRAAAAEAPAPVETPAPTPTAPSDSSSQTPPAAGNQPPAPAPAQPSPPADPSAGNGQGSGNGNGNAGGNGQVEGNAPADPGLGNGNGGGQGNGNAGGTGQAGGGAPADPGPGDGNGGGNGQGGGSGPADPGPGNGNAGPGSEAGNGGNGEGVPGPANDDKPGKGDDNDRDDDDDNGRGKDDEDKSGSNAPGVSVGVIVNPSPAPGAGPGAPAGGGQAESPIGVEVGVNVPPAVPPAVEVPLPAPALPVDAGGAASLPSPANGAGERLDDVLPAQGRDIAEGKGVLGRPR
jgi:hypothetical protein